MERFKKELKEHPRIIAITASAAAAGLGAGAWYLFRRHQDDGDVVKVVSEDAKGLDSEFGRLEGLLEGELDQADVVYLGDGDDPDKIGQNFEEVHGLEIDESTNRGRKIAKFVLEKGGSLFKDFRDPNK